MDPVTRLVHLLALTTYLGVTLALVLVVLPAAAAIEDPALQRRMLARALRPFNVLTIGALGVLIMSGAVSLTDLKVGMRGDYQRLLWPLAGKLTLTFLLTMVGTYVSFGLAHRLVRAEMGSLPVEPDWQAGILRRLRGGAWMGVAVGVWTTWVGINLLR